MIGSAISHLIGQSALISFRGKTAFVFPELIILIAALWMFWFRRPVLIETYRRLPALFRYACTLILLGGLVSVVVSGYWLSPLQAYAAWIIFPMLGFFLLLALPKGALYARVLLYGMTLLELIYALGSTHGHSAHWKLIGTFSSANYFAMLLIPALVLFYLDCARVRSNARSTIVMALLVLGALLYIGQTSAFASQGQIWHTALVLGSQQPLAGVGFLNFPTLYTNTVVSVIGQAPIVWSASQPLSLYLAFWLNLGVLGLTGLGVLIWEACKKQNMLRFLPFLSLCLFGLFDTPYFYVPIVYVFWLTLAIGLIDGWQNRQTTFFASSKR